MGCLYSYISCFGSLWIWTFQELYKIFIDLWSQTTSGLKSCSSSWLQTVEKMKHLLLFRMGLLSDTLKCGLRMRRECRKRFPRHRIKKKNSCLRSRHASRHVRHARAVMQVGVANLRWRGKFSQHSRRMRNLQFYVSGKRPIYQHHDDIPQRRPIPWTMSRSEGPICVYD